MDKIWYKKQAEPVSTQLLNGIGIPNTANLEYSCCKYDYYFQNTFIDNL